MAVASTFGTSVPVGYNIGVINAPAVHVREWCNQTVFERYGVELSSGQLEVLWSTIVSIFLVGGAIGSLGGAWIADRLGRYVPKAYQSFTGHVEFEILLVHTGRAPR